MKKSSVFIACAVCAMTVLTTACSESSGNSTSAPAGNGNSVSSAATNSSANTNSGANSSAGTSTTSTAGTSTPASTPTSTPANSTPADTTGLSHGTWSGKTYTSAFLGVKGEFDSDWVPVSDKELATAIGASEMSVESMKTAMKAVGNVTDMMVQSPDETSSVNVVIEDTSVSKTPTGDKYFSTMLSIAEQQFEAVGAAMGVDMKAKVSESTIKFCGDDTRCLYIVLTVEGEDVHEIQVPFFNGNYITNITFAAKTKEGAEALVAKFTKV